MKRKTEGQSSVFLTQCKGFILPKNIAGIGVPLGLVGDCAMDSGDKVISINLSGDPPPSPAKR